ncbi:MAG TPA: 50S ribosomal protein L15 [Dongiaceae bacterium]|jgi:large subunit ribosomal protein L15|nr:50S ribosomal protein L15 [Dongiaceae bacterium]
MKLNDLRDNPGARKKAIRVGRGIGSGKGKTGGRGGKGQTARSGWSGSGFEGGQNPIYRRLPKRGFTNIFRKDYAIVNTGQLQRAIDEGRLDPAKTVTAETLKQAGLFSRIRDGVRVLAQGTLQAKLVVEAAGASKAAIAAIEKAGGKLTVPAQKAAAGQSDKKAGSAKKKSPTA